MEVFATRLFALKIAKLNGCQLLGSAGIRSISNYCASTLLSLDISRSIKMDSETIGWIAGTHVKLPTQIYIYRILFVLILMIQIVIIRKQKKEKSAYQYTNKTSDFELILYIYIYMKGSSPAWL